MASDEKIVDIGLDLDLRKGAKFVLGQIRDSQETQGVLIRNYDTHNPGSKITGAVKNFILKKALLELMSIFEAVAALPNLKFLRIQMEHEKQNELHALPAPLLTMITNTAVDLVFLRLQGVSLLDGNDFEGLSYSLMRHPCLIRICFVNCGPGPGITLEPLMFALCLVKSLEEVEIIDSSITSEELVMSWTGDSLIAMAHSENLVKLRISCLRYIQDRHIDEMAQAQENSKNLVELVIEGEGDEHSEAAGSGSGSVAATESVTKKKPVKKKPKKKVVKKKKPTGNAADWLSAVAPDGKTYYYNTKTNATQWHKPDGWVD